MKRNFKEENEVLKKENAELVRISHGLTFAEGAILLVLLRQAVLRIYGW